MALNTFSLDLESGSSQYASVADDSGIAGGAVTLECWVRLESQVSSSAMEFISTYDAGTQTGYAIGIDDADAGTKKVRFFRKKFGTANHNAEFAIILTVGQWYHLALTHDGTQTIKGYINGLLVVSTNSANFTGNGSGTTAEDYTNIGAYRYASASVVNFTDGLIDEGRVWNTARTAEEIHDNIFKDVTGEAGLVGYWKLNNDYTDSSGNGNDLTAANAPVFSTTVPHNRYASLNPRALGSTVLGSDANLQGYWKLDDVLTDGSGNGNTLTNPNSAAFASGKFSNAIDLESGSSNYLAITDAAQTGLDINGNLSISLWVNPETVDANNRFVLSKTTNTTDANYFVIVRNDGFQFSVRGLSGTTTVSGSSPAVSQWYNLVGVYDGSSLKLYVNGVLTSSVSASGTPTTNSAPFNLGTINNGTATYFFDGLIDDVAIFNRALTAQEIFDLYVGEEVAGGGMFLMF